MIFFRLSGEAAPYSGAYKGEDLKKFARRSGENDQD
jgi:hypothetical protein